MMKLEIFFISILDTLGRLSEIEIINLLYIPFLKSICIECGKNLPGSQNSNLCPIPVFLFIYESQKSCMVIHMISLPAFISISSGFYIHYFSFSFFANVKSFV